MSNEGQNQQVRLKQIPQGNATVDDFEVVASEMPQIDANQILVQSHYLGVDAALRLIVRDSDEFLFRVRPGDLIHGSVAGQVIESNHPDFAVGEYVLGSLGMQNYAVAEAEQLERCAVNQAGLSTWRGGFGVSGLTAYFALIEECKPQPGQTVLINGAAGAVGSMAGQIARLAGARVIGITGSDEKCRWLTETLGYHHAINYRHGELYEQIAAVAPDRLDVIFDNVGGNILDESLRLIGMRGTVLLCGSTSQYPADEMRGPANYIWLGTMRARLQGFVVFDYAERYAEARARMRQWLDAGHLQLPEYVIDGDVDQFPQAFVDLYDGKNLGKTVVKLPAAEVS